MVMEEKEGKTVASVRKVVAVVEWTVVVTVVVARVTAVAAAASENNTAAVPERVMGRVVVAKVVAGSDLVAAWAEGAKAGLDRHNRCNRCHNRIPRTKNRRLHRCIHRLLLGYCHLAEGKYS